MYIKINQLNVYYQNTGRGKDLVILHGWKQDVSSFWGIVDQLKDDFNVWLIDLPGFGRSDIPSKALNLEDFAEIIKNFIKKQKINKPILLGHSLGGNIGLKIAIRNPGFLSKLILEDSSGIRSKRPFYKNLITPSVKFFNTITPNIFGLKERLRYKFYKYLGSDYYGSGELKQTLINILKEDLSNDLSKINTDTLIIWGEKDKQTPLSSAKKIYQKIIPSRLEIFENGNHYPHLENPQKFVNYVKDFA